MRVVATVQHLTARWRSLTTPEAATAAVLLGDAAVQVFLEIPDLSDRLEAGDQNLFDATIRVECAMVKRAMSVADDAIGVTSTQTTTGPFSQSLAYSNPMGDLYLTKGERRLLGGSAQKAFTIDMAPDRPPFILDELAAIRAASAQPNLSGFEL